MADCLEVASGSALDCLETLYKLLKNDFSYDLDLGLKGSVNVVEESKFRCLFDQILCAFSKTTSRGKCFLPLPPMLGNGQTVDLFKLYLVVRERGGYETVSDTGLWDWVAENSGLGYGVGSVVKLIYSKYLNTMDRWSQKIVKDKDSKAALTDSGADLCSGFLEVESELSEVVSEISFQKKEDREYLPSKADKSCLNSTNVGQSCESGDNMMSDSSDLVDEGSNRKRKRECHRSMLNWIAKVARNPCDPEVGSLPERSKWKNYGGEQLWKQVLLAREAMFLKRNVDINVDQSPSNWLRRQMHPSMFEDHLRSSQRVISVKESQQVSSKTGTSSESSSGTQSDLEDHFSKSSESLSTYSVFVFLGDTHNRKRVPVGPFFQADVPEYAEETYKSDSRWLGSRVWPLESGHHNKFLVERDHMGKGRQDSCGCQYRGSVECVRFHIAEKRMRVKLELGLAFSRWKFDKMGEEVALCWTNDDEKIFQGVIKSNPPSLQNCFWDEIMKSFPSKKREELVSYYFNVYLLQRRSYQNRSTPSNIDSDDEESEFGSLSDGRHETGKTPGSIFYSPKKTHLNS